MFAAGCLCSLLRLRDSSESEALWNGRDSLPIWERKR